MQKTLKGVCFTAKVVLYVVLIDAAILALVIYTANMEPFRYVGF